MLLHFWQQQVSTQACVSVEKEQEGDERKNEKRAFGCSDACIRDYADGEHLLFRSVSLRETADAYSSGETENDRTICSARDL